MQDVRGAIPIRRLQRVAHLPNDVSAMRSTASSARRSKHNSRINKTSPRHRLLLQLTVGLLIGAGLVYLDGYAFGGETSPIVTIGCLLVATAGLSLTWGTGAWVAASIAWVLLPLGHVVKRVLGIPDTIQPNTYISIAGLAAVTLVAAIVGGGVGLLTRRLSGHSSDAS